MRTVLLCATSRGLRVLDRLVALAPDDDLVVCSFPEEPGEPPFLEAIRERALSSGARFYETRRAIADEVWAGGTDLLLAVSWRYLIPSAAFARARRGAFVIHDSLLPAYRGFSPTVWAVANRERETGATLFAMSEEMDAGEIIDQRRIPILEEDRIGDVMMRVTEGYLDLLEGNLTALRTGTVRRMPQDHARATYCRRRVPSDNAIRWEAPTDQVYALIRAVTRPYSGAFTRLGDRKLTVWEAQRADAGEGSHYSPGVVVRAVPGAGAIVRTGDGALLLTEVQLEGDGPRNACGVLVGPPGSLHLGRDLVRR